MATKAIVKSSHDDNYKTENRTVCDNSGLSVLLCTCGTVNHHKESEETK